MVKKERPRSHGSDKNKQPRVDMTELGGGDTDISGAAVRRAARRRTSRDESDNHQKFAEMKMSYLRV